MSTKRISPTATLLRNSRLFSMPAPLSRPLNDLIGHVQSNRASDTATLPYPIQQAITTPPSSLGRGDWGLKRPLPLRSTTNTSTPVCRINAIDTREHITDFESASDLTLTLRKFQELKISITMKSGRRTRASGEDEGISVFEDSEDNTDSGIPRFNAQGKPNTRWKFHGPWPAGMNEGEFGAFVEKEVSRRRAAFLVMLRDRRLKELQNDARSGAKHEGLDPEEAASNVSLSEKDFTDYLKTLRQAVSLGKPMSKSIEEFFDLPTLPVLNNYETKFDDGPPRTHRSAGISYLKSNAYLDNHPKFGPQARRAPVEARILVGIGSASTLHRGGKVGVAGVVAEGPRFEGNSSQRIRSNVNADADASMEESSPYQKAMRGQDAAGGTLGIDYEGGSRIWVDVTSASVDPRGRINLKVMNAEQTTVDIHTGVTNESASQDYRKTIPLKAISWSGSEKNGFPSGGTRASQDAADEILKYLPSGLDRKGTFKS